MKCVAILVLLLGFTATTAIGNTLDGKGVWCPDDVTIEGSFGFWFKNDKAHNWYISIYNVRSWTYDYFEETRQININLGEYVLNRRTLEINHKDSSGEILWKCFPINSEQALAQRLKAIADQVKAENKI
tara:strand:- start:204 stop:590 length:387 start_codon:yes stop_codon:yes gene_type:complete